METSSRCTGNVLGVSWVPPSGGSLEIGNSVAENLQRTSYRVPPSGGSLEIGNVRRLDLPFDDLEDVPPSGGSLEIGNLPPVDPGTTCDKLTCSPFGGIPRNWKRVDGQYIIAIPYGGSPFGGIPRNWKQSSRRITTNLL